MSDNEERFGLTEVAGSKAHFREAVIIIADIHHLGRLVQIQPVACFRHGCVAQEIIKRYVEISTDGRSRRVHRNPSRPVGISAGVELVVINKTVLLNQSFIYCLCCTV